MDGGSQQSQLDIKLRQYQALLEISEAIALNRDLASLFSNLAQHLHAVIDFDWVSTLLYDPARDVMRIHMLEPPLPGALIGPTEMPVDDVPSGWVWKTQEPLIVQNAALETRFPQISELARQHGVKSFCVLPLNSAGRRLGALGFASVKDAVWSEDDLEFLMQVARQVALAIDNAVNFESARAAQDALTSGLEQLRLLLDVTNSITSHLDLPELFRAVSHSLRQVFHQDFAALGLYDEVREELRAYVLDKVDDINHVEEGTLVPLEGTLAGQAIATRRAVVVGRDRRREFPSEFARRAFELGLRSGCSAPLLHHNRLIGVMTIASKREDAFTQDDGELLMQIAGQVAIAVENAHAWREVETLRDKLASEKLYLEDEIRTEHNFEELIGESHTFKRILKQVETVAPTDILTKGSDLEVSLAELKSSEPVVATELSTLQEAERDHILRALKETDWVVGGPGGAAARLGMKRTTLQAKMKKLGISRRD